MVCLKPKLVFGGVLIWSLIVYGFSAVSQAQEPGSLESGDRSEARRTDSDGLVEVPGTTSAGGVGVDLRGRFRSFTVIKRRNDGTVSFGRAEEPAGSTQAGK